MDDTLAFPMMASTGDPRDGVYCQNGMYLRDYFAAKAMQSFCVVGGVVLYKDAAEEAYRMADAMMAERCKPAKLPGEQS